MTFGESSLQLESEEAALARGAEFKDNWDSHWTHYADSANDNPAQNYRRKMIFSLMGSLKLDVTARVLDIGSGQGDFALDLIKHSPKAQVLGLEMSLAGVEISRKKLPTGTFVQRDLIQAQDPPLEFKEWADCAVCSEVLEHVDKPEHFLSNVSPFLKAGCPLIVTVPGGPMSYFDKHIGHRQHFTLDGLREVLEKAGFKVKYLTGAGFPFFNLYRLVVIARGKSLVSDVSTVDKGLSFLARVVMFFFSLVFRFNWSQSKWGWQLIAVAEK